MPGECKRCTQCGEVKPLEQYARNVRKRDGRRSECKACQAEAQRQSRHLRASIRLVVVTDAKTVDEWELCLPQGIAGRVVGHLVHGRIVYDAAGTPPPRLNDSPSFP